MVINSSGLKVEKSDLFLFIFNCFFLNFALFCVW